MLGLTLGSYEAYCLDQAVWFLDTSITQKLEKVGKKRQKGEAGIIAARERELKKLLGDESTSGFADPSLMFQ